MTTRSVPSLVNNLNNLHCQYINLWLLNAEKQECLVGTVGTLLLENPIRQKKLTFQGLLHEVAKVFGLQRRKLKIFLNETQVHEITEEVLMKTLNVKTLFVSILPTTAEF